MLLFVGLGNPGDRYSGNRHNIGFMAVDRIADAHRFSPWRRKFSSLISDGDINGERVTLLKPETYMNESGRAVGEAARFLKVDPADVVVFHDELDLFPGKIRCKNGGGNAGHNGLKSISAHIGNDYRRVRLGIGHPGSKDAVSAYVLHDFAKAEQSWLDPLLDAVAASAGHLAKGADARFQSDVANRLEPLDKPGKSKSEASAPPAAEPRKAMPPRHPAGERGNKRASALADNLKKWLSARDAKKADPED